MTAQEIIGRLTELIREQADIIRIQAEALGQLGTVEGLDERIKAAQKEREEIGI